MRHIIPVANNIQADKIHWGMWPVHKFDCFRFHDDEAVVVVAVLVQLAFDAVVADVDVELLHPQPETLPLATAALMAVTNDWNDCWVRNSERELLIR